MAVLQAATDEWKNKCDHWYQYSYEQHYAQVNPVLVLQVLAGSGKAISNTNLDDVIAKIEERIGTQFKENEVVHTFGSTGVITINGLNVPRINPSEITEDKRIRVVLFKENLSTGWDCPRAETMMSFRRAEDATYIAQLLGRMIRTPLQCHIIVDDSLNDVRLYLPYFNKNTVKEVVDELQNTEGGEIPTVIDSESLENQVYVQWSVHLPKQKKLQLKIRMSLTFSQKQLKKIAKQLMQSKILSRRTLRQQMNFLQRKFIYSKNKQLLFLKNRNLQNLYITKQRLILVCKTHCPLFRLIEKQS